MENTKKCTKCGRELPLDQFYKRKLKNGKVGYQYTCKSCHKTENAEWRKNNPEKVRAISARCYHNNPEKPAEAAAKRYKNNPEKYRTAAAKRKADNPEYEKQWRRNNPEYGAKWRKNNPEKSRAAVNKWRKNNPEKVRKMWIKQKKRRKTNDPNFKIICNIRTAMSSVIAGNRKTAHTEELLGCSIESLRNHLEGLFQPGMTWDNYGVHGWHIDHIIPLSYFDFNDPEQQKRAWHYTNLQPLWAADNIRKSNKIEERQLILM
jgi:3-methyladenine DNA glycosylase AlkC